MGQTFFIHSSDEGHLGCYQVLAIKTNTAMNIVEKCFCGIIECLLDVFPRMVLLDPEVD